MDGGIAESMLIGAALGGGTSALTGKNPLMGAGIGALGGAIAPSLGEAFSGTTSAATEAAANAVPTAAPIDAVGGTGITGTNIPTNGYMFGSASPDKGLGINLTNIPSSSGAQFNPTNFATESTNGLYGSGNGLTMANVPANAGGTNLSQLSPQPDIMKGVSNAVADNAGKTPGMFDSAMKWVKDHPFMTAGGVGLGALMLNQQNQYKPPGQETYTGPLSHYSFNPYTYQPAVAPTYGYPYARAAQGGLTDDLAGGGITALGGSNMYPGSQQTNSEYSTSPHLPNSAMQVGYDPETNPYTGDISQNMASGGITSLGSYSDGGHLLKGPGDGMSDDIPARIGHKQEARLADGEFVIPADVVSHLGNGSTDAGAKQLYNMMDRVRKARTGNPKQGKRIHADKFMPAFADGGSVSGYNGNFGGSYPQYSYADLMSQLRANPQNFTRQPPLANNQQMGIQSLTNNAMLAQQAANPVAAPEDRSSSLYQSYSG